MSKGTTPRHSRPPQPVTIELDATDVTPRDEPGGLPASIERPSEPGLDPVASGRSDNLVEAAGSERAAEAPETALISEVGISEVGISEAGISEKSSSATADHAQTSRHTDGSIFGREPSGTAIPSARNDSSQASGRSGVLLGGLVGGALALAGAFGLQVSGLLGSGGTSPDASALTSEIASLQRSISALSDRVDALPAGNGEVPIAALSTRLEALEQGASSAADAPALATIEDRLADLDARLGALGNGGAADPALATEVEAAAQRSNEAAAAVASLDTRIAAIDSRIDDLDQAQTSALADLTARLAQTEVKLAEPSNELNVARAIASAGLKAAIDRGGAFMTELEALASVAPDDPAVAALREFAAAGVPTRAQLGADFPDAATSMIAAMHPQDPDAGIVDRLMSSALSVVKVRPVGEVEGDSVEAIAARIEAALGADDLDAALAEWAQLPDPAKAAAESFGKALAARAKVDGLVAAVLLPASAVAPAN